MRKEAENLPLKAYDIQIVKNFISKHIATHWLLIDKQKPVK